MFWIISLSALAVLGGFAWLTSFFIGLMTIDFDGNEWSEDEDIF